MFEIDVNEADRLITIKTAGQFDAAEAQRLIAAVKTGVQRLTVTRQGHRFLIVAEDGAVQPQAIMHLLQSIPTDAPEAQAIALVTPGKLAALQIRRLIGRKPLRCFDDIAEASAWLAEVGATIPA